MNKWAKYEFNDKEQLDNKIDNLSVSYIAIVKLGNIILEEGSETEEPILSEKYHVDVIWKDVEEHPYGWKSYAVTIADGNGVHSFYGIDYQTNKL